MSPDKHQGRRGLLGGLAAMTLGATVAPGVAVYTALPAKSAAGGASDKVRWGLLVDSNKCARDCTACIAACGEEHGLGGTGRPASDAQWIRKLNLHDPETGKDHALPVMCQHCAEPPCVDVCPTGASFKRADGIVLVDRHTCIGCRYCMMACPYKARSFIHEALTDQKPQAPRGKGTVEGCSFCVHRVDAGKQPACVEACRRSGHGAMTFGDLRDPDSEVSRALGEKASVRIRADLGLDPAVHYQGLPG
ncbi:MAG: 4Fe-4S dicluster domain-containing protein [Alphaproteobacteria bacterium]|jgi:molybdopterin-containing oxidoreductase family iron-sulfur binding subunit|nr:4Fe-4S dicluster domain-containing protein [Alphaproteobacteria bacterium]MDP6565523.1 4Fe-4S dicluster domain-containing protein [Alphaproteobacteria bacterium]MDP6815900.1 4Fe-4S dicluster domain-containing protein [Alphaproteobacteria bacterium]